MKPIKKRRLERAGWVVGDSAQFLQLSVEENRFIELKLALATGVRELRERKGLTQAALAEAMGVQRKHVNELCNDRRNVTAATALILARVFGNSPDFWLNVQRRGDLWEAMNSPRERERIERATPLGTVA